MNVPELRLYSLLLGESVYEFFYMDMIMQNANCLESAKLVYSQNTAFAPTNISYSYVLNPQNFPVEVTSKSDNSNSSFLGKRSSTHYTISYVTR
ncbi:hypothetical protein [Fibrella aquatilis]|uniref:Uncharacterized protein n=1 Tax=Fibrella aquatilis TaxID=2817059 RepID=A0A939K2P2_9BACT|nr:hypothetical protein [Fibrella aquatilis]MBO0934793.1 hypothetical protein [Fibrella aquatilis]